MHALGMEEVPVCLARDVQRAHLCAQRDFLSSGRLWPVDLA
jgi:hypothetical protein